MKTLPIVNNSLQVANNGTNSTPCDEESERVHSLIGDLIIVSGQIIYAFQNTFEERVLKR